MNPITHLPEGLKHRLFHICAGYHLTAEELVSAFLQDVLAKQHSDEIKVLLERYEEKADKTEDKYPHVRIAVRNNGLEEFRTFTQELHNYVGAYDDGRVDDMQTFVKLAGLEPNQKNYDMLYAEVNAYLQDLGHL